MATYNEKGERPTPLELLRLRAAGRPRQVDVASRMLQVAGKAYSGGHISSFESGSVAVSENFLRAVARALDVSYRDVERGYWATRLRYCQGVARAARQRLGRLTA